jgi:prevent-host-death family protein
MEVSVTEAKARLTDLVRRAEAGETVFLTRRGQRVAQIAPFLGAARHPNLRQLAAELSQTARAKAPPGTSAARSADFLYDDTDER